MIDINKVSFEIVDFIFTNPKTHKECIEKLNKEFEIKQILKLEIEKLTDNKVS